MLSFEEEIMINQWIQGIIDVRVVTNWYDFSTEQKQNDLLVHLASYCRQARACDKDGLKAINASELNPRRSASVILSKGVNAEVLNKLSNLKNNDGREAFILLINLLKVADTRRKMEENPENCNHWWHRDLSNPSILKDIRASYERGEL